MWSLFRRHFRQTKLAPRKLRSVRPRLEALEDRCLLSAGALDPTFGNGAGYVTTALPYSKGAVPSDSAYSALIQTDGKIIAAGEAFSSGSTSPAIGLVRYNPDGSLDPSFGNAGELIGPASVTADYSIHAAFYPTVGSSNDGKIVVGGLSGGFSIARYNTNGTLDTSFGSKGIATANFGTTSNHDVIFEVIQPDGKIVALGQSKDGTQAQVARFNPDGSLDATFGQGGLVTGPVPDPFSLLQPDGKLLMVGDVAGGSGWELARYNPNGTLDSSFGNGGVVINSSFGKAYAGTIYPVSGTVNDGKIVVVGEQSGSDALELARYNANGSLDGTFGNGGLVTMPTTQITGDYYNTEGVAIQTDGRIVVTANGGSSVPLLPNILSTARFNVDGSLDTAFGVGGFETTLIGVGGTGHAVSLQPNGDIVVAGASYTGTGRVIAVARYLGDSPSFSVTGFPSSVTAGTSGSFTVTARNTDGSTNTNYTGTVHFTSSDARAVLPADYTFTTADQGVHTFNATLVTAGSQSLTATDTTNDTMIGGERITITPAATSQFVLSAPLSVSKGSKFSLTLTVEDAFGNVVTGYVGTVHFTSSDGTATLPMDYTFTAGDSGVHTFTNAFILKKKGTQTLTVTDTQNSALTATNSISVT